MIEQLRTGLGQSQRQMKTISRRRTKSPISEVVHHCDHLLARTTHVNECGHADDENQHLCQIVFHVQMSTNVTIGLVYIQLFARFTTSELNMQMM
ncbi:hypothetical protein BLOT_006022 [Blomia tropicalis]|nr:hypothetical protein BLOT_006022 [Blomia tropicalis]